MQPTTDSLGWIPDLPDQRDLVYKASPARVASMPTKVDLSPSLPPALNQGTLGSCTANAIALAFQHAQRKQGRPDFTPSRLFIYFNERVIEGTVGIDAGAQIRNGFKSIGKEGACPETMWPYLIPKFRDKPTAPCYEIAETNQAIQYARVAQSLNQLRGCLAEGYPVVFGFMMYESFQNLSVSRSGLVYMPKKKEAALGGHAVLLVGYDDRKKHFIVRNSWGPGWGWQGNFFMPYDYVINPDLACDFWRVTLVE